MTRLLEKALRRSNAVDREALCIVAGQKVRPARVRRVLARQSESGPLIPRPLRYRSGHYESTCTSSTMRATCSTALPSPP